MDLIQDLDMILPLLKTIIQRHDLDYQVCATDWLVKESPRVDKSLRSLGVKYTILSRKGIRAGFQPRLGGIQALITAAESTAGPHRCAHAITKRANQAGIHTYTLQHGFENIGLTYFDEVEPPELIHFASQKIFTWGNISLLSPQALPETVARCIPLGCIKEVIPDTPPIEIPGKGDYLVGVFENLHWHRYSDDYRQNFLKDLEKVALSFPNTTFLVKPHHAGKWLTKRYEGKLPQADNLVIANPQDPQWEAYTAAALIKYADGVITTPSTVAVDAARADCPVSVISYGLDLAIYEPLKLINSLTDWQDFVTQLQQPESKLAAQTKSRDFMAKNIIPGDAPGRMFDLIAADVAAPIVTTDGNYLKLPYPKAESPKFFYNIPFEYKFRKKNTSRLITRLDTERGLYLGDVLTEEEKTKFIGLIVIVDREPNKDLETTLRLWQLQSCPLITCLLVPQGNNTVNALNNWLEENHFAESIKVWQNDQQEWEKLKQTHDFVIFTRPGDILLPNLAHTLKIHGITKNSDVVVWNMEQLDKQTSNSCLVADFLRRPQFELHTIRHLNYIGTGFAIKPELAAAYPYDLFDHILRNDAHLFHIWLSFQSELNWYTHPEFATLRSAHNQPAELQELVTPFLETYQEIFSPLESQFSFEQQDNSQLPYQLKPLRKAKSISVLVPFRDKPEYTCRCLKSLSKQKIDGELEIVLINNQSLPSSLTKIKNYVEELQIQNQIKLVNYDYPYNHSRQCNLGVESSTGEVVVFFNNDAELVSESALEEMAAWALIPGVGTVGCQITAPDGRLICAGVKAKVYSSTKNLSIVQESEDPTYANVIREAFGNTFACAAMSRENFHQVGAMNAKDFPSEYNDAEFLMRTRKAGYTHIYLGHLLVYHIPGATRQGCDEMSQQTLLRQRFPETTIAGLFQLESDQDLLRVGNMLVNDKVQKDAQQTMDEQVKRSLVYRLIKKNEKLTKIAKYFYQKLKK